MSDAPSHTTRPSGAFDRERLREPGEPTDAEMIAEIAAEEAERRATLPRAVSPIPVRKRYYPTKCEHCDWVGSTEVSASLGATKLCYRHRSTLYTGARYVEFSSPKGDESGTAFASQAQQCRHQDGRPPFDNSSQEEVGETQYVHPRVTPRFQDMRSPTNDRRRHRSVKGAAHRCATTPLTVRCSSAVGLSSDRRASLSASGALNYGAL